jgi:hypothetical protein
LDDAKSKDIKFVPVNVVSSELTSEDSFMNFSRI